MSRLRRCLAPLFVASLAAACLAAAPVAGASGGGGGGGGTPPVIASYCPTDPAEWVVLLPDGSTVTLNSRSRARIAFDGLTRTVDLLEGEALFRAAQETSRPFIVRADGTSFRAIGTEFDIDKRNRGTVVTVLQGRVAVSAAAMPTDRGTNTTRGARDEAIVISAGEQLDTTAGRTSVPTRANVSSATAWMQGRVMLQSATLEEVAERFNRYSPRRLVTEDHGSVPFHLSGVFSTDPDFLIRYLRERPDIQVEERATEIRIIHTGAR